MRQTTGEKIDPLVRIQEEIKEVVRREQEYRQLVSVTSPTPPGEYGDQNGNATTNIEHNNENDNEHENENDNETVNANNNEDNESSGSISISPVPPVRMAAVATSLALAEDSPSNTPSLEMSVHSKESIDGHHSDDSGISASSSPINCKSTNGGASNETTKGPTAHRYIGPNCYNLTPEPPQQKLMARTVSTPHLASNPKPRQFAANPAHRGVMQRFIASRGKLQLSSNNTSPIMLNGRSAAALINAGGNSPNFNTPPNTPISAAALNANNKYDFGIYSQGAATLTPAVIERDAEGRPIRRGYIPVEVKIQRELKDLKSRESELKKIRKIRESTSDLLAAIDNENIETDEDDSEVEHCYGPGKLRAAKSNSELCDSAQSNNSISPRASPTPDHQRNGGGMRPAVSLAQLCDLDPEEAPSSHRLIAQWESLIQQNA